MLGCKAGLLHIHGMICFPTPLVSHKRLGMKWNKWSTSIALTTEQWLLLTSTLQCYWRHLPSIGTLTTCGGGAANGGGWPTTSGGANRPAIKHRSIPQHYNAFLFRSNSKQKLETTRLKISQMLTDISVWLVLREKLKIFVTKFLSLMLRCFTVWMSWAPVSKG